MAKRAWWDVAKETRIGKAITSPVWWDKAMGRAARTFAQGFAAVWVVMGMDFEDLTSTGPWQGAVVATVASLLTSLGGSLRGDPTDPSFRSS